MTLSVEELFERYRRGDTQALAAVFDRTAPELWRVARYLCGSRFEADDLVQTTYLVAMETAPRWSGDQALLPWLLGILANHVRMARRRQRRSIPVSALPPRTPEDPVVAAERDELRTLLRQQVDKLPETYRAVLVLQLEQGMTAAEVAHALGRPHATIRSQLFRGLELLRRALPESALDGRQRDEAPDLSQVRHAVLVVATGQAAAVEATIAVGTLAMKKLIAAAVVLLAIGILWIWMGELTTQPKATIPEVGAEVAADQVIATDKQPQTRRKELDRAVVTDPDSAAWIARGEVMHGSVAPLPGARFVGRVYAGWQAVGDPLHEATLHSDAEGGFAWTLSAPTGPVTLSFAQSRPDITIMADARTFIIGDEPPQDLRVIAFVRDCRVTGMVTDEQHRPIVGAWVKASSRDKPKVCGVDGAYSLTTSATYGDTTVTAGAPGFVLARQTVKVKHPNTAPTIHFKLRPAVKLAGRVVNEKRKPVADARVITFQTHAANVRTAGDGRYEIPHLDPSREQHTVQVEHDNYLTRQRTISRAQLKADCDFVLQRGASVRGRVLGPTGRGVGGAHIHLGQWIGFLGSPRAVSNEGGVFEIRNVPPGQPELRIFARGYAPALTSVKVPDANATVPEFEVRLEPGHAIVGKVIDRDGNALHRIRITPLAGRRRQQVGADAYTARDGSFRLADLPAGRITLDCFGMDVAQKKERDVAVDRDAVTIVMEPPAQLAGRVVDDATGRPLTRFSIRFVEPELRPGERRGGGYGVQWTNGVVFADADGRWRTKTERFDAGAIFGVEASADGYGPVVQRRAHARVNADPHDLVLRLRRAAQITGRVVDQRLGQGIEGAQLAVFDNGHPLAGRDPFVGTLACRTGEGGEFAIEGVPAGSLSIVVRHPDWPLTFDGPFQVAAGATTTRVVTVRAGATITGTVLDQNGAPVAGAVLARGSVQIGDLRVPHASVSSDAAGRFRFGALPTARYWLHASGRLADGSTMLYSKTVNVTLGEQVKLRLEPSGRAALEIEVVSADALPATLHLRITRAKAKASDLPFAASIAGAKHVVRGLPSGSFRVHLSHFDKTVIVIGSAAVSLTDGVKTRVRVPVTTRKR